MARKNPISDMLDIGDILYADLGDWRKSPSLHRAYLAIFADRRNRLVFHRLKLTLTSSQHMQAQNLVKQKAGTNDQHVTKSTCVGLCFACVIVKTSLNGLWYLCFNGSVLPRPYIWSLMIKRLSDSKMSSVTPSFSYRITMSKSRYNFR